MNRLFASFHRLSRRKKYRYFERFFPPSPAARLLNVGASGTSGLEEHLEKYYPYPERVVGGGVSEPDVRDYARSLPHGQALVFDGCRLPFRDQSFDVVYSNAVLEHLPSWEAQERFAREVRRVGRKWFVTTPNFWYPIEAHYHLPGIQLLPAAFQHRVVRALGKTPYDPLRLLGARQMRALFPGGRILRCRVTFYPETLVAMGPGSSGSSIPLPGASVAAHELGSS